MTHYWWMHWFWITFWTSSVYCKNSSAALHSVTTNTFQLNESQELNRSVKAIGDVKHPLTIVIPSVIDKNLTSLKNISYISNLEFLFQNLTSNKKEQNESVVQKNITQINVTDNQVLINTISPLNHTSNITYLEEESNLNQSLIENPEHIGMEKEEKVDNSKGNLTAAGITSITLGCVVIVGVISGASYVIYRNRGFNRPQVLNDRCSNPDSSGYIDDASVRDNSEEMYSLDNDSFLNSLEAMTIQNYWTDTVKHTKL